MSRNLIVCTLAGLAFSITGCANFVETRTLNKFATALEEGDIETLKAHSSDHFNEKALRLDDSLDDFKLLRIPSDGIEVVTVKDISEDEKHIEASVEGSTKPIYYKLVREEGTHHWVVDDIVLQRNKGSVTIEKNVSEQMDLYLSVREFLQTWQKGDRISIQSHMTPKLSGLMETLPESYFSFLHSKVKSIDSILDRFRPQATIDDKLAIVRMKHKTGMLGLVMKLEEDGWLIRDMAIEVKDGQHITSLAKAADSLRSSSMFLTAYAEQNKPELKEIVSEGFYKNSLLPGDISTVSLPSIRVSQKSLKLMMPPKRANARQRIDFEVPHGEEIVTLTLKSIEKDEDDWKTPGFEVTDVKLFPKNNLASVRKLSAVLTAEARVNIFHKAFVSKNLKVLKYASSFDFNQRVWNRLDNSVLPMVQIELPQEGELVIESIKYDDAATEVFAMQGNTPVTYILREHDGQIRIDDVEMPMSGRPNSFKKFMDLALPVYYFANTIQRAQVPEEMLNVKTIEQRNQLAAHYKNSLGRFESLCSFDFNHSVWQSTEIIPGMIYSSLQHISAPITQIDSYGEKIHWVIIGDENWGARAKLIHEREAYRIDEMKLIAGPDTEADLKLLVQEELNRNGRSLRTLYPVDDAPLLANEQPMPQEGQSHQTLKEPAAFQPPGNEIEQVSGWEEIEVDFGTPEETAEIPEPLPFEPQE